MKVNFRDHMEAKNALKDCLGRGVGWENTCIASALPLMAIIPTQCDDINFVYLLTFPPVLLIPH